MKLVTNSIFEWSIIACIVASSILLSAESPLQNPDGAAKHLLLQIDIVFTSVFALEAALKIFAFGFLFNGNYSYLRSLGNVIDFMVVITGLTTIFLSTINLSFFKVVRLLRILRPLRVVSKNEGLRISIISLVAAVPNIFTVCVVALIFFMIFGIIAVNYYKGLFYSCLGPDLLTNTSLTSQLAYAA